MQQKTFALACAIVVGLFAADALAQSATFNAQTYPFLGNNHFAADLNGDGKPDLAGVGANAASVMLNNGNGTFAAKVDYPLGRQTQAVAVGDFNSDGKANLVATLNDSLFSFALLTGTGTGTFNSPVNFPNSSGFDSPAVIAADLNNDTKLDVVLLHTLGCFTAPCTSARSITVLLGNGDGTFQPAQERDVALFPRAMALGDFNRDGIKDLAIGGEKTELRILLGNGNGTFVLQPLITLVPGGDLFAACNDVDIGDFNRDAIQDLVVPLGNGRGNAVLRGHGDGNFAPPNRVVANESFAPLNVAVADYNGDGFQDIARAMGDGSNGLVEIMHGNGDVTFQAPVAYLVPPAQSSIGGLFIAASDFNRDGRADLALTVAGAATSLRVMINSSPAVPPPFILSLASRKTHVSAGNFDVPLTLAGTRAIEPRSGGATGDHQIVVTFDGDVSIQGNPQAQVTSGAGQVGSNGVSNGGMVTVSGDTVLVPLTNVANAQTIQLTLFGVNGAGNLVIPISILFGDTNADAVVNAGDTLQTRSRGGQATDASNFRSDVNIDGFINSGDTTLVRSRAGNAIP